MLFENNIIKEEVNLEFSRYQDGSTGIRLVNAEDGSPTAVATISVDIPEVGIIQGGPNGEDCVVIKNYSENEDMDTFLIKEGIIEPEPLVLVALNLINVPMHVLTEKGLNMLHEQVGVRPEKTKEERDKEMEEFYKMIEEM